MKKKIITCFLIFSLILNISLIIIIGVYKTKSNKQEFKVYSFDGGNKDIRIDNGIIIISPDKQLVNGGHIIYTGNENKDIQSYSEIIYLNSQGSNSSILCNSVSVSDGNKGLIFPNELILNKSIGQISSEKLFREDTIKEIKDNLYFSLTYSNFNGEEGNYVIKLNVNEIK